MGAIEILLPQQQAFVSGSPLSFEYKLVDVSQPPLEWTAIEASVLWHTEGKGEEDFGVHFFERRTTEAHGDLKTAARASLKLPLSPLSYDGNILKIRWCIRVRAFPRRGRPIQQERTFRLVSSGPRSANV